MDGTSMVAAGLSTRPTAPVVMVGRPELSKQQAACPPSAATGGRLPRHAAAWVSAAPVTRRRGKHTTRRYREQRWLNGRLTAPRGSMVCPKCSLRTGAHRLSSVHQHLKKAVSPKQEAAFYNISPTGPSTDGTDATPRSLAGRTPTGPST